MVVLECIRKKKTVVTTDKTFQEKKFRLQNKFDDLKDKGKRVMENIGEKRMDMISKWEEKSRDFIDAFLLLFGREGRLVCNVYIYLDISFFFSRN